MKLPFSKKTLFVSGIAFAFSIGIFLMFRPSMKSHRAPQEKNPVFAEIEMIAVNLQAENGERILQLKCTAQLPDAMQNERFTQHMPEIRNRLILLASGKKPSELASDTGKRWLQREILAELRKPFGSQNGKVNVEDVYFTSFIIE